MGPAFSTMLTRIGLTKITLLFTSPTFKSWLAFADELIEAIFTGATV